MAHKQIACVFVCIYIGILASLRVVTGGDRDRDANTWTWGMKYVRTGENYLVRNIVILLEWLN